MNSTIPFLVVLSLTTVNQVHQVSHSVAQDVDGATEPNAVVAPRVMAPPEILWFHSVSSNSLESLDVALSSGLVSHVIVLYMHRNDADIMDDKVQKAVQLVKARGAKLIWCRDLWPYYENGSCDPLQIYEANYYVHEVFHLRKEGELLKADAIALDCEPYGESVFKPVFKDPRIRSRVDLQRLAAAVTTAVDQVGKVDYILPAGSTDARHPLNRVSQLGQNRISESTYYNLESRLRKVQYPYEIFGAYVRTTHVHPEHPLLPFFTVDALFTHSEVWSDKKGVLLYTDGPHSLETAKSLLGYTRKILLQYQPQTQEPAR
ncbi:MAG: hypothetical protein GY809_18520 [Planctomycetes bacterium]|nr:hypothetical protein [Planctomycetota bacterium]